MLALVVAGIAVARLAGDGAVVADPTGGTPLVVGPTPALDDATDDSPSDAAGTDGAQTAAEAGPDPAEVAARAKTARTLERKVATRRALLRDRVEEAADLARTREAARRREQLRSAPFEVRVGSFNVLGSQHTAPGGERRRFPPASVRSPQALGLMQQHGVDIIGMQELQEDQLNFLTSRTGMVAYPGYAWGALETDNSILYDPARFEMVSGSQFTIPFMGRPRPQPILRLRVRDTGREFYVVNTHPSAGHTGSYAAERAYGQDVLVGVIDELEATGLPVLLTGDMNDREAFYCRVVARADLRASNGGGAGCAPPSGLAVDWVVGSPQVSFADHWTDTSPVRRLVSDHFFISATAYVG